MPSSLLTEDYGVKMQQLVSFGFFLWIGLVSPHFGFAHSSLESISERIEVLRTEITQNEEIQRNTKSQKEKTRVSQEIQRTKKEIKSLEKQRDLFNRTQSAKKILLNGPHERFAHLRKQLEQIERQARSYERQKHRIRNKYANQHVKQVEEVLREIEELQQEVLLEEKKQSQKKNEDRPAPVKEVRGQPTELGKTVSDLIKKQQELTNARRLLSRVKTEKTTNLIGKLEREIAQSLADQDIAEILQNDLMVKGKSEKDALAKLQGLLRSSGTEKKPRFKKQARAKKRPPTIKVSGTEAPTQSKSLQPTAGTKSISSPVHKPKVISKNQVDIYLKQELKLVHKQLPQHNLSQALFAELGMGLKYTLDGETHDYVTMDSEGHVVVPENWRDLPLTNEFIARALKLFSETSFNPLTDIIHSITQDEVNNALVVGPAGVGKSHLKKQLIAMASFGAVPDELKERVGMGENSPEIVKLLAKHLFGNVDIIAITDELLALDPTGKGEAFNDADARKVEIVTGLADAATREFRRSGRRAVFILDEAQGFSQNFIDALKPILVRGGFKNPEDPYEMMKDSGLSYVAMTTLDEMEQLIQGDTAKQRRFNITFMQEPSEEETFRVVKKVVAGWSAFQRRGREVSDDAIWALIHMRRFLSNPPEAMPGVIFKAIRELVSKSVNTEVYKPASNALGLKEVQTYLKLKLGLSDVFFEGPEGQAPLEGLAEQVKALVVGQDEAVDQITKILQAQLMTQPVRILLGGESGTGKDTLFEAFQFVLFNHTDNEFQFDIAGMGPREVTTLLHGSETELPRLAQLLDRNRAGMIALNEMQDLPTAQMDMFKRFLETGEVFPVGKDRRRRVSHWPVWILGQFGEAAFYNLEDKEAVAKHKSMSQEDVEATFKDGKRIYGSDLIDSTDHRYGKVGAVPSALLQRMKKDGIVILTKRLVGLNYVGVAKLNGKRFVKAAQNHFKIRLNIDDSLYEQAAGLALRTKAGIRGTGGIMRDMISVALSQGQRVPNDQGHRIPLRETEVTLRAEARQSSGPESEVFMILENEGQIIEFNYKDLSTRKSCESLLQSE